MKAMGAKQMLVVVALGTVAASSGCRSDVLDLTVDLQPEVYAADFGDSAGTIPVDACTPSDPGSCQVPGVVIDGATPTAGVQVSVGCDPGTLRCFAQAQARTSITVDVLMDDNFTSAVERRAISFVRIADLAYTVPVNTLTFDLPSVSVYAGPEGSTTETDPGVAPIGVTAAIAAGTVVTEPLHLTLADGTMARSLIEGSIQNERPFVVIFLASPRLESGDPVPGGAVEIHLAPRLLLGFPR
jgi:hypothetical protein